MMKVEKEIVCAKPKKFYLNRSFLKDNGEK
jgi:hypothetical protein